MGLIPLDKVAGAIFSQTPPLDTSYLWMRIINPAQPNIVEPNYYNGTNWTPLAGQGPTQNDITVAGIGTVGGYSDGDIIPAGTTLDQFIAGLLSQTVPPTYFSPSLSISKSGGTLFEVGDQQNIAVNVNFGQNDAGDASEFRLLKNAGVIVTDNTVPIPEASYNDLVDIINGNVPYQGSLDYLDGPIKNDNFGNPDPTGRILAGNISSNTLNISGVYPWFYGISATDVVASIDVYGTGTKVIENIGGSIQANYAASTGFLWFAVPSNFNNNKTYTSWFENALNQGAIGGGSNLFTDAVTKSVSSTGLNNNWTIDFDFYITNFQTAGVNLTLS